MTLDELKSSVAWDSRYNLPLFPRYSNPHLYCAYFSKLTNINFGLDYVSYAIKCETSATRGLLNKWPENNTDFTSHDELIGAAYMCNFTAEYILDYLESQWGCHDNTNPGKKSLKAWMYRFLGLVPFLKARANKWVNPLNDLAWAVNCLLDVNSSGMSGHLQIWLMSEEMQNYKLSRLALRYWQKKMDQKGYTTKVMFNQYFNKPDENFI